MRHEGENSKLAVHSSGAEMDRRHLLKLLDTTAAFAGLTPVELEALLTARAANNAVDLIGRGGL